jgi:5-(carboxyamino)imidazole ribonucleotide synthase
VDGGVRALLGAAPTPSLANEADAAWAEALARGLQRLLGADRALSLPDVHLHLYGKASVRPRRKMGHVNRLFPLND